MIGCVIFAGTTVLKKEKWESGKGRFYKPAMLSPLLERFNQCMLSSISFGHVSISFMMFSIN